MEKFQKLSFACCALSLALFFSGCEGLNDPYYPPRDPYYGNNYGGGGGYYDDSYNARREADRAREARQDLERERYRLEQERRRAEQERENSYRAPPPAARPQERCPSGFSPSENKCSQAERKRGCRDIRLPGGLGCVSR